MLDKLRANDPAVRHLLPRTRLLLMYGTDAMLLQTRCALLQHAGFEVDAFTNSQVAGALLQRRSSGYGAVLLCHSSSAGPTEEFCEYAADLAIPVYQIRRLIPPENLIRDVSQLRGWCEVISIATGARFTEASRAEQPCRALGLG